jgi:hypothetical protein
LWAFREIGVCHRFVVSVTGFFAIKT